ncbi:MAG: M20/M25/M40 family metallo-hydrolase [Alphaproteobacteria bacterium]|nr:M20/M25/M40 family metallo-hydrolase [Alphaproteobacteria bacterium]
MRILISALLATALTLPAAAQTGPGQARFRALYKELVETNTTLSAGDCTLLAHKMGAHLKAAGYPDADLHYFVADGHPKEGGLVARLPGSDPHAKAILLLGHIDVVEARREDWTRDPFTLIEENGYFYGRGASDMKPQVAAWVNTMMRLKEEHFKNRRTVKMALTCGEETSTAFNGASYLSSHERELIDAAFALNEGGGGRLNKDGKPLMMTIQAAEKFPQNYQLEVTNPGGHSSRPMPDNAIYHLAAGLTKISAYAFPIQASDITKQYFAKLSPQVGGEMGAAMTAFAKDPTDKAASAKLASDPSYNAILHTTCVATLLSAGHANNALPQRADANINCRIFPGTTPEQVRAKLQELVADPQIKVTLVDKRSEVPKGPQPINPAVFGPVEKLVAKMWPGIPVTSSMSAGATDGAFLTPAGIPTYGVSGMFGDPDGNGAHGLNERMRVKSAYQGNDFLYEVVKVYANQP